MRYKSSPRIEEQVQEKLIMFSWALFNTITYRHSLIYEYLKNYSKKMSKLLRYLLVNKLILTHCIDNLVVNIWKYKKETYWKMIDYLTGLYDLILVIFFRYWYLFDYSTWYDKKLFYFLLFIYEDCRKMTIEKFQKVGDSWRANS